MEKEVAYMGLPPLECGGLQMNMGELCAWRALKSKHAQGLLGSALL